MSTLTLNSKAAPAVIVRNLLAGHPFVVFFVLAFAGSWLFFAPMIVGQDGLSLLPYHVPFWLYVVLFLAASFSGPTVAALVVTAARDGKAGVTAFCAAMDSGASVGNGICSFWSAFRHSTCCPPASGWAPHHGKRCCKSGQHFSPSICPPS